MKTKFWDLLLQGLCGFVGAVIGAIVGFLAMMTYGGNFGCWRFIDLIFNLSGYESCGLFGGWIGIFLGVLMGIFFAHRFYIKDSEALSRFKKIFLPLWVLAIFLTFGLIYLKNTQEAQSRMADLETKVEKIMIESNLIDLDVPIEITDLKQSSEMLEVLFTQGNYELTVKLMTGASGEKWVLESGNEEPASENRNVISYIYSNEWNSHLGLVTYFDYEKNSELSGPQAAEKNASVAIEGLKILENDPRLLDSFKPKVEELRSSLMVSLVDIGFEPGPIEQGDSMSE